MGACGLSTTLVLALLLAATGDERAGSLVPGPRTALPAVLQDFTAPDLEGRDWSAAELRGRVALLDFWATWCAPCLAELPRLRDLYAKYGREDFVILGISLDVMSRRALISWLNRNRIDWPQIHDRRGYGGELPQLFGIDRLPRTILVDRDGRVAAVDLRGERLAGAIDSLVRRANRP